MLIRIKQQTLTSKWHLKKQILQAIDDVKQEVQTEKENLQHLKDQMQEILNQLDTQKQKLEGFIEETRSRFKTDKPSELPSEDQLLHREEA